jgi:hypothetical protein
MLNTLLVLMLVTISPTRSPFTPNSNYLANFDFGAGGPDTFGYTWLDSDTTAPGAPVYNWIPINGTGTRITGLADDNVVGPFPIGFDFPYYWYAVNSFYVGSNGYISFGDNFNAASPFHPVPSAARPNNVLAPLMSDLDFSTGVGSCWYWTNADNDTLIVEYDSARFWSTGGVNTFQIILSRPDSTITFQFKDQSGTPYNGWTADSSNSIGIENVTGTIGLRYLFMGLPDYNMPHASLSVRFTPPLSSSYQVHDVGIYEALAENSAAIFRYNGDTLTPWAKVKNTGNQPEVNFPVCGQIKNQSGTTIYADTVYAGSMNPGQIDSLAFAPDWVASSTGQFSFTAKTVLTGDMYTGNDQAIVEMRVVTYPAELQYENVVTTTRLYSWNGPGGYGNLFIPPRYPCTVTGAKVFASATVATAIFVGVLDDNGPAGAPGDTLTSTSVNITSTTGQWYNVTFTTPAQIYDGGFFIGAISAFTSRPSFGMDTLPPFSRRGWEYTAGWASSRHSAIHDVCIRALVSSGPGIGEELTPAVSTPATIVTPNPFRHSTVIRFANPQKTTTTLNIYNSLGIRVKSFATNSEQVIWSGKDNSGKRLPEGIYFLKLAGDIENIEKLIITR